MDLRTRHEENSSVSFFSSIVRIFTFSRNRICQKINARKNILNIAWYTSCCRLRFRCNTRSPGFSTSQDKDTAAPFDHADRKYVVDGIRVVLSPSAPIRKSLRAAGYVRLRRTKICHQLLKKR